MSINNSNKCPVIETTSDIIYAKEVYAVLESLKLELENVLDPQ
jgi:hypothetical protein